ncbi:MAG: hypothetical protein WC683_07900 [bacterium]
MSEGVLPRWWGEEEDPKDAIGLRRLPAMPTLAAVRQTDAEEPRLPDWNTNREPEIARLQSTLLPYTKLVETVLQTSAKPDEDLDKIVSSAFLADALGIPFPEVYDHHDAVAEEYWGRTMPAKSARTAIADSWTTANLQSQIGMLASRQMMGDDSPEIEQQILELEAKLPDPDTIRRSLPVQAFKAAANLAPFMLNNWKYAAPKAAAGAAAVTGAVALTGAEVALPAVFASWFIRGMAMGSAAYSFQTEGGLQYRTLIQAGIPKDVARNVSMPVGAVNAALEMVQLYNIPGVKQLLSAVKGKIAREIGEEVVVKGALAKLAQRATTGMGKAVVAGAGAMVSGLVTEPVTEVAQEAVNIVGDALAASWMNQTHGTNLPIASREEVATRLKDTYVQTALAMLVMGAPGSVGAGVQQYRQALTVKQQMVIHKAMAGEQPGTILGRTQQAKTEFVQGLADQVIATQAEISGKPAAEVAKPLAKLELRGTEIDAALAQREEAFGKLEKFDVAAAEEMIQLAQLRDELNEVVGQYATEAPAPPQGPTSQVVPLAPEEETVRGIIRQRLPQLSEREVTASSLLVDFRAKREGKTSAQYVEETFAEGIFSPIEESRQIIEKARAQGVQANAGVDFLADSRAIIHAVEQTDFKALTHEFAHVFGRHLSADERAIVERSFGTGAEGEERWAEGMIQFWQTGETAFEELRPLMTEMADLLRNARRNYDDLIPEDTKRVMDEVLGIESSPSTTAAATGVPAPTAVQRQVQADLFGETAEAPPPETPTIIDPAAVPSVEVPLDQLTLSEEVPNFKEGANAQGVIEPLRAERYQRLGTAPIVVWERLDGRLEVITGRHRLDLARRLGEKTIPAQIVRESEGFTAERAMTFDAEANIRDGQGSVRDYANYFKHSAISEEEASSRGLLSRDKGRKGFAIGKYASDGLYALYRNGEIGEEKAAAIAAAAPTNEALQDAGIQKAKELTSQELTNYLAILKQQTTGIEEAEQGDLFGRNESFMVAAAALAKEAAKKQAELRAESAALKAAMRLSRGEQAKVVRRYGFKAGDTEAIQKRIVELEDEILAWSDWTTSAEKQTELRKRAGLGKDSLDLFQSDDVAETGTMFNRQTAAPLRQPTADVQTIYQLAADGRAELRTLAEGISSKYGADVSAREELKDRARTERKATGYAREEGAAAPVFDRVLDIDGNTITASSVEDVRAIVAELAALGPERVPRIKDRLSHPTDDGYRDVLLNIRLSNGSIQEIQVTVKAMKEAKDGAGHVIYRVLRDLREAIDDGKVEATPKVAGILKELSAVSWSLYDAAWDDALRNASWNASVREIVGSSAKIALRLAGYGLESILSERTRNALSEFLSTYSGTPSWSTKNVSGRLATTVPSIPSIDQAAESDKGSTRYNVEPGEDDIDGAFDQTAEQIPVEDEEGNPDDAPLIAAVEQDEKKQEQESEEVKGLRAEVESLRKQHAELGGKIGVMREALAQAKRKGVLTGQAFERYKALVKTNRYVARRVKQLMRPPGQLVRWDYAKQMRAIQDTIGRPLPETLRRVKNRIQKWADEHPNQVPPDVLGGILLRKDINELTVDEVDELAEAVQKLRKEGTALRKAWLNAQSIRRQNMGSSMIGALGGKVAWTQELGSEPAEREASRLKRKKVLNVNLATPQRFFEALDGTSGVGDTAGPFKKFFWEEFKAADAEAVKLAEAWDEKIRAAYEKGNLRPVEMVKWLTLADGTRVNIEDAMYAYGAQQDEHAREAFLYGNRWSEGRLGEVLSLLPQAHRDWVDAIIDIFSETFPELERVRLEIDNLETERVARYLPIKRLTDIGMAYAQELSTENNARSAIGKTFLQKGMLKKRIEIKPEHQPELRTNLLGLVKEAVEKQTSYIAKEQWVRDAHYLVNGRSETAKELRNALRHKHGEEAVRVLQQYITLRARPQLWDALEGAHLANKWVKFVYGSLGTAQLAWKLSTVLIQAEGPFRYLERTDLGHVLSGLVQATIHPKQLMEFVTERSPGMSKMIDSRAIDPILSEMANAASLRSGPRRAWAQFIRAGFAGMKFANKLTILSGWKAVYDTEMHRMERAAEAGKGEVNEAQAIAAANDATYRTQPSGETGDRAPIYWTNSEFVRFMLRFTDQSNKMLNMVGYDLPQAIKEHHFERAIGILVSVGISALIIGMVRRKRPPKNADEWMEDALLGLSDLAPFGLGQVLEPTIAKGMQAAGLKPTRAKGYGYEGINVFEPVSEVAQALTKLAAGTMTEKDVYNAAAMVFEYLGVPVPALENLVRAAYDVEGGEWEVDLRELIGRVPAEDKEK